jgi:hypothetical protein
MPRLIDNSPNPYDRRFTFPKWNGTVTVLQEHRLFRYLPEFQQWTAQEHVREARYALQASYTLRTAYYALVQSAEATYGNHGPLISGIVRGHFPEETKTILRTLCRAFNRESERSLAHWYAARKTLNTWLDLPESQTGTAFSKWFNNQPITLSV